MSKDTGGPAFPPAHDPNTHEFGMSLRDYFAAKAMQAYLTDPSLKGLIYIAADESYKMADAMLQAREAA